MRADRERLLYREFGEFRQNTPNHAVPNGPVCGNGDIGVVLDREDDGARLWLSKNDFWCYRTGDGNGMKSPALLRVKLAGFADGKACLWQDARTAHIGMRYENDAARAALEVCAPRGGSVVLVRLSCEAGSANYEAQADTLAEDPLCSVARETRNGRRLIVKRYAGDDVDMTSCVATALGACAGTLSGCLEAGQSACFVAALVSDNEADDPAAAALAICGATDPAAAAALEAENARWWDAFWAASDVYLPEFPTIEQTWYLSHYILGCCCNREKFAPGIFGSFLSSDAPNWASDYHLNYNHEAPFWGLYSSNHIELADAYDRPVLEYVDKAKQNARTELNCRGIYAKVGIGPRGFETAVMFKRDGTINESGAYLGQKSNAGYAGINFIMRYYHTLDRNYLEEKAYPYLIEVIDFWEDYLVWEDGRYVDKNDCIHENAAANKGCIGWPDDVEDYADDRNPVVSLALIRTTLRALLDMSETLGRDEERRGKWRHMLEHLSGYPTQQREGRTVLRYTEAGMDWCDSNSLGIQPVYPAGDIGLDSDPELLRIARDTHAVLDRWEDYNAFPTCFTAAARLGCDPEEILRKMEKQIEGHGYPNGFVYYGGGGIECCSAVPSAINEMLVQNYAGRLRLFPVWDRRHDAVFRDLRTYGALLVSAGMEDGKVTDVSLVSERGGTVTLVPPWTGEITVTCCDRTVETTRNAAGDIVFETETGAEYRISEG